MIVIQLGTFAKALPVIADVTSVTIVVVIVVVVVVVVRESSESANECLLFFFELRFFVSKGDLLKPESIDKFLGSSQNLQFRQFSPLFLILEGGELK